MITTSSTCQAASRASHGGQLGGGPRGQGRPFDGQVGQDASGRPRRARPDGAAQSVGRLEGGAGQPEVHVLGGLPQHRLGRARDGEGDGEQHLARRERRGHLAQVGGRAHPHNAERRIERHEHGHQCDRSDRGSGHGGQQGSVTRQPGRGPPVREVQRIEPDGDQEGQEQGEERHELIRQDLLEDRQCRELPPGQPGMSEPAGPAEEVGPQRQPEGRCRQEEEQPGERAAAADDQGSHRGQGHAPADVVGRRPVAAQVPAEALVFVGGCSVRSRDEQARERDSRNRRQSEEHARYRLRPGQPVPGGVRQQHDGDARGEPQRREGVTGARAELAPADDRHRGEPDDAQEQAHHQDLGRNEELCDQQHGQDERRLVGPSAPGGSRSRAAW